MSKKFNDLKYYMLQLARSIDDIEDKELRERIQSEFNSVDDLVADIETDLIFAKNNLDDLI